MGKQQAQRQMICNGCDGVFTGHRLMCPYCGSDDICPLRRWEPRQTVPIHLLSQRDDRNFPKVAR